METKKDNDQGEAILCNDCDRASYCFAGYDEIGCEKLGENQEDESCQYPKAIS